MCRYRPDSARRGPRPASGDPRARRSVAKAPASIRLEGLDASVAPDLLATTIRASSRLRGRPIQRGAQGPRPPTWETGPDTQGLSRRPTSSAPRVPPLVLGAYLLRPVEPGSLRPRPGGESDRARPIGKRTAARASPEAWRSAWRAESRQCVGSVHPGQHGSAASSERLGRRRLLRHSVVASEQPVERRSAWSSHTGSNLRSGRPLRDLGFAEPFRTLPPVPASKRACRLAAMRRVWSCRSRTSARGCCIYRHGVCLGAPLLTRLCVRAAVDLSTAVRCSGSCRLRRLRGEGSFGICDVWERPPGAPLAVVGARPPRGLGRTGSRRHAGREATDRLLRPR